MALIPPLAVGAALRFFRLHAQVLTGDEMHAVDTAADLSLGQILSTWTYAGADYSVPLAAFFRLLLMSGFQPGELAFRLPSLVAGLSLIGLAPLLLWRRIGTSSALVLAWLLALSPMLVLYSRIVRSYSLVILLGLVAVLAFWRWWEGRRRSGAIVYCLVAPAAVYLHLGAASFVLAPFVHAAGVVALREWRDRAGEWRSELPRLASALAASLGFLALLLFPARASLAGLFGQHGRGGLPSVATWFEVLQLDLGTTAWPLLALLGAATLRGALLLWQRGQHASLYIATLFAVHLIGLAVLAPNFLETAEAASRYVLVLLPLLLIATAVGLAEPLPRLPRLPGGMRTQTLALAALLAALFLTGPLFREAFASSAFTHSRCFLQFASTECRIPEARVPDFYRQAGDCGGEGLLEYPWMNLASVAYNAYERVHDCPLRMVAMSDALLDPRLGLRNVLWPDPEQWLAGDARYLVLHRNLRLEESRVLGAGSFHALRLSRLEVFWRALERKAEEMRVRLEADWGPPDFEEEAILVWDLARIREREAPGP